MQCIVCVCVSAQEIHPPKAADFVLTTDSAYSVSDMFRMEMTMLDTLTWNLYSHTPIAFVTLMLRLAAVALHHDVQTTGVRLLTQRSTHPTATVATFAVATTTTTTATAAAADSGMMDVSSSSTTRMPAIPLALHAHAHTGAPPLGDHAAVGDAASAAATAWHETSVITVLESLLHVDAFCRVTELLDLVLLHPASLRWPASLLAAAVVVTVHPWVEELLPRICPSYPPAVRMPLSLSLSLSLFLFLSLSLSLSPSLFLLSPFPFPPRCSWICVCMCECMGGWVLEIGVLC
jgi:hypothetical protein